MKTNSLVFGRRMPLTMGALLILVALGGCGGGGGGGSGGGGIGPNPPGAAFDYPPNLRSATTAQIGGFSAAYTVDTSTKQLTSVAPGALGGAVVVTVNTPNAGDYRLTVTGIVHSSTTEPTFSFTVPTASMTAGQTVAGATCAGGAACFRTGTVTATDGETVTVTDLNVSAAQLTYSTMGVWSKPSSLASSPTIDVGGGFSFGVQTRGVDLPTTGTATYNGPLVGRYANGTDIFTVGATATAHANFGSTATVIGPGNVPGRSVAFSTSGMTTTSSLGASALAPTLEMTGSFTYVPGTNQLNSTSFATASGLTGTARGVFYGPPGATAPFAPPELGGAFAVSNGTNQSMVGSFGLKR